LYSHQHVSLVPLSEDTFMAQQQDWEKQWGQLVAKVWADPQLKARLLSDPKAVLQEQGLPVPPGMQIRVVENTEQVIHLPLPAKPSKEELSEEDLAQVAGGIRGNDSCSVSYFPKTGQSGR